MQVPWVSDNISDYLDFDYLGNSGKRFISPLVIRVLTGDELTQTQLTLLCRILYTRYINKWEQLYTSLQLNVNPTQNYDITETMTNDTTTHQHGKTSTQTNNLASTNNSTSTNTPNLTNTTTPNLTSTSNTGVYGFNSSDGVDSQTGTQTQTGTSSNTTTGTDTQTIIGGGTDTGTITNVDSGTDTDTRNYTKTVQGYTPSSISKMSLINESRQVALFDYFDEVYKDIDNLFTLKIFN